MFRQHHPSKPPMGGNLSVTGIDYLRGFITIDGGDSWSKCPLEGLLSLNFTNSVFSPNLGVFSLISCPSNISWTAQKWIQQWIAGPITCLRNAPNQLIYAAAEFISVDLLPDVCTKISDVKSNGYSSLYSNLFNQTTNYTVCVQYYYRSHIPLIAGTSVTGAVLVIASILFVVIYITRRSVKELELRLKIETFLAGYNTTKPTRYTLTELRKITKKFKRKLGQGGFGSVYKGELPNGIPVAVKLLETSTAKGDEFINEVATIGRIHHFNIVCY
ncbi:G-type lectin S-receptor-like serine/threonine-protein kinase SD2-5 [Acorus calamus]|uniref:G-type lectin S-receptor-like serine/threonine-protein kinase SD2-5 n=1 Tax=Acorus calamus TaxID=4465 RepID=A0AAV9DEG4_ACOCL|nr:G-type lectin S-receptor-like serine/threonine-protein kinase SD2-5 [Acorus calamus]